MTSELADSIRFCQSLARRTGKNFYWSFLTLPRPMRRDMCVLYAFMRLTDDIGDRNDAPLESRRQCLDVWRRSLAAALAERGAGADCGSVPALIDGAVRQDDRDFVQSGAASAMPAVAELVRRRSIPVTYLQDVIDGVESDLTDRTFPTFAELERYCYHVAGAVGLCCIHIWGFQGDEARQHAIDCGTAFQLTNILRDLGEDARQGRVYLPQDELRQYGVTVDDLRAGRLTDNLRALLRFQSERARRYYASAARLLPLLSRPGRRVNAAMLGIYGGLLEEIERREFDVFSQRVELSTTRKLWAAFQGWLRPDAMAGGTKASEAPTRGFGIGD